ncbi:MAG: GNAT family N-acetyltransferase [Armatimonadota bacterium]|nr:MAG: GNAT family N-acetyltransferase [Armatimonadota bacterium]
MTESVTIRRATADDRAALGALWHELMDFHYQLDPEGFQMRADALDIWLPWLDEWLADPERVVLVADAGHHLVGYIFGKPEEGPPVYERRNHGAISEVCVTAGWRRRGLGRQLVAALLDWFRERGLTEVHVSAATCNPVSNAFWRAMGFHPHTVQMRRALAMAPTKAD